MAQQRWKQKARALAKLAEDQRGTPEGDLARQKLLEIVNKHPEARNYEPVQELIERDLALGDIAEMHRNGISTDGRWTGRDFDEALAKMLVDYKQRIAEHRRKRKILHGRDFLRPNQHNRLPT